jgi:hypothetical protein
MSAVSVCLNIGKTAGTENPEGHRRVVFKYDSSYDATNAAEEVFIFTNAPYLLLSDNGKILQTQYYENNEYSRPLCPGDIVIVDDNYYLCLEDGWKELVYD